MRNLAFAVLLFAGFPLLAMDSNDGEESAVELDELSCDYSSGEEDDALTVKQAIEILQNSRYEQFGEEFFFVLFLLAVFSFMVPSMLPGMFMAILGCSVPLYTGGSSPWPPSLVHCTNSTNMILPAPHNGTNTTLATTFNGTNASGTEVLNGTLPWENATATANITQNCTEVTSPPSSPTPYSALSNSVCIASISTLSAEGLFLGLLSATGFGFWCYSKYYAMPNNVPIDGQLLELNNLGDDVSSLPSENMMQLCAHMQNANGSHLASLSLEQCLMLAQFNPQRFAQSMAHHQFSNKAQRALAVVFELLESDPSALIRTLDKAYVKKLFAHHPKLYDFFLERLPEEIVANAEVQQTIWPNSKADRIALSQNGKACVLNKSALSRVSKFFSAREKMATTDIVDLGDENPMVIEVFKILESGKTPEIDADSLFPLLQMAQYYQVDLLLTACEDFMLSIGRIPRRTLRLFKEEQQLPKREGAFQRKLQFSKHYELHRLKAMLIRKLADKHRVFPENSEFAHQKSLLSETEQKIYEQRLGSVLKDVVDGM